MCTRVCSDDSLQNWIGVLDSLEDPEELWDTFKRETLEAAKECINCMLFDCCMAFRYHFP